MLSAHLRFRRFLSLIAAAILLASFWGLTIGPKGEPCLAKTRVTLQKMMPKLDVLPRPKPPVMLHGSASTADLLQLPRVNLFGFAAGRKECPFTITYVANQSIAFRGGLQAGDKAEYSQLLPDRLNLVISRNGKLYRCILMVPQKDGLAAGQGKADNLKLKAAASAAYLARHQIVLLVDSSDSMNTTDCPGGKSRWQWCREQAGSLFSAGDGVLKDNVSITIFSTNFGTHNHCKFSDLASVFKTNSASGETNMAPPLDDAFASVDSQLFSGRPAVIVVITDGRPTDEGKVKQLLIDKVNSLRDTKLLSITFIEIGTPGEYLKDIDENLVKQGAKVDIVTVIPFTNVDAAGLVPTIAKAVQELHAQKPIAAEVPPAAKLQGHVDDAAEKQRRSAANSIYVPETAAQKAAEISKARAAEAELRKAALKVPKVKQSGIVPKDTSPQEIDESAGARKGGANRTYSFPNSK